DRGGRRLARHARSRAARFGGALTVIIDRDAAAQEGPESSTRVELLLEKRNLHVKFANSVRALDGVDLDVMVGETLAVVGESGCGKTTLGRTLALLQKPSRGTVRFAGSDLTTLSNRRLRSARRH